MYKKSQYNNYIMNRKSDGASLYYNASTGAIAWLNKEIQNAFDSNCIAPLQSKDYFQTLIKNGFVVPDIIDEYERYAFKARQFVMDCNSDFASYIVALTMECNLRCLYCFEEGHYNKEPINDSTIKAIYRFITQSVLKQNKQKLNINWFGGEPMLAFDRIVELSKQLMEFCQKHNINYTASMVSNGTLLDENKLNILINKCNIKHIQISLDGDSEEYIYLKKANINYFNTVMNNVGLIAKSSIGLSVRLNVCRENQNSLLNLVDKLVSIPDFHGIIYAGKIMNYNGSSLYHEISDEDFALFESEVNKKAAQFEEYKKLVKKSLKPKGASCGYLVHNRCLIDSYGYLYRCEHHINNRALAIGDVKNGFYHNKVDNLFLFHELPQKCRTCSVMPICMGGCASDRILYDKWINCDYVHNKVKSWCIYISNT